MQAQIIECSVGAELHALGPSNRRRASKYFLYNSDSPKAVILYLYIARQKYIGKAS